MSRLMEAFDASATMQWCAFTALLAFAVLGVLWRRVKG